jgi:hypothetical protein
VTSTVVSRLDIVLEAIYDTQATRLFVSQDHLEHASAGELSCKTPDDYDAKKSTAISKGEAMLAGNG